MKMTFEKAVSMGLTMMHTYAAAIWNYSEDYNLYLALNRRGRLPVRMTITLDEMYEKPYVTLYERNDPYRQYSTALLKSFVTVRWAPVRQNCLSPMTTRRIQTAFW